MNQSLLPIKIGTNIINTNVCASMCKISWRRTTDSSVTIRNYKKFKEKLEVFLKTSIYEGKLIRKQVEPV